MGPLRLAIVLLLTGLAEGSAQEFNPHDPAVISDRLNAADAVVVGTFKTKWCVPWFDGWHCTGAVHVAESLRGTWPAMGAVPFRWIEPFGSSCLVCDRVSQFDGQSGIWFLTNRGGAWTLTPTDVFWCGGPFATGDRDTVVRLIQQKSGGKN